MLELDSCAGARDRAERGGRRGVLGLALALAFALSVTSDLAGQSASRDEAAPLAIQVNPSLLTPRPGAPIPVTLRIEVTGAQLLQGRLRFERTYGFPGYETAPITLREGEQTYRCLLPPLELDSRETQVTVVWDSVDGPDYALGRHVLAHSLRALYPFAIARCRPVGSATEIDALELERVDRLRLQDRQGRLFWTQFHEFAPADFPAEVHSLCAYDLVVIPGTGLVELDPPALARIEAWVRAGGALAVSLRPDLSPGQRAFLDRLAGAIPEVAGVRSGAIDLGRVAVFSDGAEVPTARRAEVVYDLLRLRSIMRARAERGRALVYAETPFRGYETATPEVLEPLPPMLGMNDVEVLPIGMVLLLLSGLVLLVGPLDRIGLGWIRRRSWTWVTVPLVCVTATLLFVELSEYYVGSNSTGTLTVIDLGEDGRVLRQYRFELSFPARHGGRRLELSNQLVERFVVRNRFEPEVSSDLHTAGSFPSAYECSFGELKWTPYLLSRYRIGGSLFDDSLSIPTIEPPPSESAPAVQLGSWSTEALNSIEGSYDRTVAISVEGIRVRRRGARHPEDLGAQAIARMTTVPAVERGSLVSGVAPLGGRSLEDLPIAGDGQYVLGVLATRGADHYLFRRRFDHE